MLGAFGNTVAQPPDSSGRPQKWYDTLAVTTPRYARVTTGERMALAAYVALSLPTVAVVTGPTLVPPSFVIRREGGVDRPGVALQTGVGFGGDTMAIMWFPIVRFQGEVVYFFGDSQPWYGRASLLADHRFGSIDRRKFFWLGVAGGLGISTDFSSVSPYAEGFFGLSNPLGIRYVPLFPMHHYGLRFRTGYNVGSDQIWYEAAIAATSTFSL
jgi:hypothetical protein